MRLRHERKRRGAVLPLVALCMIAIMGMLALAIDVGMVAIARSQCQNAADAASMAGARTINGLSSENYNYDAVPGNAIKAASNNKVYNNYVVGDGGSFTSVNAYTFTSGQVKIEAGAYAYFYNDSDPSQEGFKIQIPRTDATEPYSTVRATVTADNALAFGRVFGLSKFTTSASATAVHRPRDVMIITDLSGSMRFQSLPATYVSGGGSASPSSSSRARTHSLNPETVYPKFGHYASSSAGLYGNTAYSTGSEMVDPANISTTSNSGSPIIEDFYANGYGVTPGPGNRAFSRSPDSYESNPGGDGYLRTSNDASGNPTAKTVSEIVGTSGTSQVAFENYGYQAYRTSFSGYTEGPGYWGKTFFVWPPDPRGPSSSKDPNNRAHHADNGSKDWRKRFFFKQYSNGTLGWLDHNNLLFDPSGTPATGSSSTPSNAVISWPDRNVTVSENGSNTTLQWRPNYLAILKWISDSPAHFPAQLRAGRIKYYDAIPSYTDTTLNDRWWTTATLPDLNERFWRTYIDFVLGLQCTGAGQWTRRNVDPDGSSLSNVPLSALIGNGDYFTWGTFRINPKPTTSVFQTGAINNSAGYAAGTGNASTLNIKNLPSDPDVLTGYFVRFGNHDTLYRVTQTSTSSGTVTGIRIDDGKGNGLTAAVSDGTSATFYSSLPVYMDYADNPHRPRHQLWFGPMTFVDFLGNYNTQRFWWPGNVHEAQAWACKVGIQTAIEDIQKNHPSDFIGLIFFSSPKYSTSGGGQHNRAVVPLGRNYADLKDSLWFPPTTIGTDKVAEITPYDEDFDNVPRAKGGTAPGMGFMIAYNLLSSSTSNLRFYSQPQPKYRGTAGGLGRRGANRLVIFSTDGAPNTRATASLAGSGKDSYYPIRIKYPENLKSSSNEWPSGGSYSNDDVYDVVKQICRSETASPPGYSSSRKPALVYSLGYGSLFDPTNSSTTQSNALDFLQTVAYYGNTAKSTNGGDFPDWQRIYGTNAQRAERMRVAIENIMQAGVQVSLIE